jgi:hypothetical protein
MFLCLMAHRSGAWEQLRLNRWFAETHLKPSWRENKKLEEMIKAP